jgi:hypothetical protein
MIEVPEALAEEVRAGMFTVWTLDGIGLALLLLMNACGTESYEAGRIYLALEPTVWSDMVLYRAERK